MDDEKLSEKRKLLFNAIFDIYKIFLGAGLTVFGMVIIKVAFSEGNKGIGLALCIADILFLSYISLVCGGILLRHLQKVINLIVSTPFRLSNTIFPIL